MCGRYVSPAEAEIERLWHIGRHNDNPFGRRFNVSPTSMIPILRVDRSTGELELFMARWGLIPAWWKEPKPPRMTHNARSEEAATRPMWKGPLAKSRCLIPAVGWYEWRQAQRTDPATGEITQVKQPYFLHSPDGRLLTMAGVMAMWKLATDDQWRTSCAILTRDAVGPAADVHDRMPVLLSKDAEPAWLDSNNTDAAHALATALEDRISAIAHYPVNVRVNVASNEGEALIHKLDR
jgi:putative SOS response-associated peptidase YedK